MTLILSLLTRKFVLQVSDRRLTDSVTREIRDDDANKAIFVGRPLSVFAFTGYAGLGSGRTDLWLARELAGYRVDQSLRFSEHFLPLCERSAAEVSRRSLVPIPQAFSGVCWISVYMPHNYIPVFIRVSNFEDDKDVRNYENLREFKVSAKSLDRIEEFKLIATGYRVSEEVKNSANRRLRRALRAESPAAACEEVLAYAIREVAKETGVVGQSLLSSCIPHPLSINSWDVILSSRPNASLQTFRYLPHNDSDPREVGPVVLTSDGTIMSDFCKQTFPSGEESIKVRIDFKSTLP